MRIWRKRGDKLVAIIIIIIIIIILMKWSSLIKKSNTGKKRRCSFDEVYKEKECVNKKRDQIRIVHDYQPIYYLTRMS
jgi:hypothetical protein